MNHQERNKFLEETISELELPDSAYEKAEIRYNDIGNWLQRSESECSDYEPHVFSQGSFRLGTAIYPLNKDDPYDLDIACNLTCGISKSSNSQKEVKNLVGRDIISYRKARSIKTKAEEKHRCWRLEYADDITFHIDIVPCIPEDISQKIKLNEQMQKDGFFESISKLISKEAVSITDDRHPNYHNICENWSISNPKGYAIWFENRMKQASEFLSERAQILKVSNIDNLPYFKWKNPLQRCIQLLKRHRDVMFKEKKDSKPISIIITTLAAHAYSGEINIESALTKIINRMDEFVRTEFPKVPNPVNSKEDFTDKWHSNEGKKLELEENFWAWLNAAKKHFNSLTSPPNGDYKAARSIIEKSLLTNVKNISLLGVPISAEKLEFPDKPIVPKKPQGFA